MQKPKNLYARSMDMNGGMLEGMGVPGGGRGNWDNFNNIINKINFKEVLIKDMIIWKSHGLGVKKYYLQVLSTFAHIHFILHELELNLIFIAYKMGMLIIPPGLL